LQGIMSAHAVRTELDEGVGKIMDEWETIFKSVTLDESIRAQLKAALPGRSVSTREHP
jgi:hypothetical protein